ncbi:MAG: hypothetical protein Q7R57_07825, partial [Dehalococcoidales bacterium]|nr:hypothetical protein [Dehalococcoidales bacterium]
PENNVLYDLTGKYQMAIAVLATTLIVIGLNGYFLVRAGIILRLLAVIAGALLLAPGWQSTLLGAILAGLILVMLIASLRREQRRLAAQT